MARSITAVEDLPATMALPIDQIREIAGSLSIEGISEIEDARGFPILDRPRWDALRDSIATGFTAVLANAYARSLERPDARLGEVA